MAADFTSVRLAETARDVVRVDGARGRPATDTYKVSIAYRDGFAASGTLVIAGPDAAAKAPAVRRDPPGTAAPRRASSRSTATSNASARATACRACCRPSATRRRWCCAWRSATPRKAVVERFTKEFAPLVTSGPPGVTGYTTGRPAVREVFAYWPALIAKDAVTPEVSLFRAGSARHEHVADRSWRDIAHGRSGDKGNHANVAVIAYTAGAASPGCAST